MVGLKPLNWVLYKTILTEEQQEKTKICEVCEHRAEWNRCGICGCFIASMCLLSKPCPIGKW